MTFKKILSTGIALLLMATLAVAMGGCDDLGVYSNVGIKRLQFLEVCRNLSQKRLLNGNARIVARGFSFSDRLLQFEFLLAEASAEQLFGCRFNIDIFCAW